MTAWTATMDEILTAGWTAGLSEPQIAKQIVATVGGPFSRHSISSRRRRLKLPERAPEVRRDTLVLSNQTRRKAFIPPPQPPKGTVKMRVFEQALPGTDPRPWMSRRFDECAWPVGGTGADTMSCCAKVDDPKVPYCPSHLKLRRGSVPRP